VVESHMEVQDLRRDRVDVAAILERRLEHPHDGKEHDDREDRQHEDLEPVA